MIADDPGQGNLHFVQKTFQGGFEFDILFSSDSSSKAMTSTSLTEAIQDALSTFGKRFESIYSPRAPFRTSSISSSLNLFFPIFWGESDTFTEQARSMFPLLQNMLRRTRTFGRKSLQPNRLLVLKNAVPASFTAQYPPGHSSPEGFSGMKASISKLSSTGMRTSR